MCYKTIFVCFVGSILVKLVKMDPLNVTEITFKIESKKNESNVPYITCDHNYDSKQKNKYTVLEGEEIKIITQYNKFINDFTCRYYSDNTPLVKGSQSKDRKLTTFNATKDMGKFWNCTMLTNRHTSIVQPVVLYQNNNYSAAYCYMQIHVRQTKPPQWILVNNMALQAVRTNLSKKDADFTAEYQYADGDVVDVACVNFGVGVSLKMEFPMADTLSDKFNSTNVSSSQAIGFTTKLHSGHNNSYMICTAMETNDYTKVMVRFVMRTEFNIVSIKINGKTLRPKLYSLQNHKYRVEYKYLRNQPIKVVCEVNRTDMVLVVTENEVGFVGQVDGYKNKVIDESKHKEMSFHLNGETKELSCASDYTDRGSAELVSIIFSEGQFPIEYSLHMDLPPNGTVMQLYYCTDENSHNVIFYEFEDDERLQLKCGPLPLPASGPVLYLQFENSQCTDNGCYVTQNLNVTNQNDNSEIVCRLMEKEMLPNKDKAVREIRVIFRKRVPTTTTTTTSTTTTTTTTIQPTDLKPAGTVQSPSQEKGSDPGSNLSTMAVIAGAVVCIIIICVSTVIIKRRKRNHSQGGPHDRNYENLATPSETSIPVSPPQWESNYAVPVDRRTDDTTYSVPCHEPGAALYSTPTPKNLRNKKQKPVEPTYAVLDMPNAHGRKNVFKETDDPNYSEVYANRQEQCYAKVLPKSVRNKMVQDNNPYSNVTNEPSYANTGEPEPMYCEPAKAAGSQYANLNNAHYANSNAQEYVEPAYCEPQKLRK